MTKIITGFKNAVLRNISKEIEDFSEAKKIGKLLRDELKKSKSGVGLAAPQIGINKRVFIVEIEKGKKIIFVNPKILYKSKKNNISQEGCLSLPGIYANVSRQDNILVEYFDEKGEKKNLKLEDFGARVFLHELDHLDGILFMDKFVGNNVQLDKKVNLKDLELEEMFEIE